MTGSADELNRGYFGDMSELKQRGGKLVVLLNRPLHRYFEQNDCLNYFFCFRWILIQFKRYFWLAWSSLVLTLKACWLNKMNKFTVLRDLNFVAKNLGVEFFKGTLVV
ncbi:hypothetical protein ES332_D06G087800v1 [Gossypium tomentosum]|uniref:Uncharacterized protein n=1 Tax=Gossypium tomentosum TaxID=34277 RepID=A0A5D2KGZ8_GOSTO|nr:hypothetical protein ES332_D06G087800v1 [Gossypium tomentosum]